MRASPPGWGMVIWQHRWPGVHRGEEGPQGSRGRSAPGSFWVADHRVPAGGRAGLVAGLSHCGRVCYVPDQSPL